MTLIKLRLNVENQHLAYLFSVHQSIVSRNSKKWIYVIYERLKPLVNDVSSERSSNDVWLSWIILKYFLRDPQPLKPEHKPGPINGTIRIPS